MRKREKYFIRLMKTPTVLKKERKGLHEADESPKPS